jgi:hypothetical protein
MEKCPTCNGEGGFYQKCICDNGTVISKCSACEQGWIDPCYSCLGKGGDSIPCPAGACQNCNFTGSIILNCPQCNNLKKIKCNKCQDGYITSICELCNGKGSIWKECRPCNGTGEIIA